MRKKEVTEIDYKELEKLAGEHLGLPLYHYDQQQRKMVYSFVATEECGNDSSTEFTVKPPDRSDKYELEEIAKIENDKEVPSYRNDLVLDLLCEKGILAPGDYIVQVCW